MQLDIQNLSFGWSENLLFKNINLHLNSGDLIQLCGDNGSGKTTVLQLITGMIPHFHHGRHLSGEIALDGNSLFTNPPKTFFPALAFIPTNFIDLYFSGESIVEDISIIKAILKVAKKHISHRTGIFAEFFPEVAELKTIPYSKMSHNQKIIALTLIYYLQSAKLYAFDENILTPESIPGWLHFYNHLIQQQCMVVAVTHILQLDGAIQWSIRNNQISY